MGGDGEGDTPPLEPAREAAGLDRPGSIQPPRRSERLRALRRAGAMLAALGLAAAAACGVGLGSWAGRPLSRGSAVPVRQAPFDTVIRLDSGRVSVFALTGRLDPGGDVESAGAPSVGPDQVSVRRPDGLPVRVAGPGLVTERITRGSSVFVGVARFVAPTSGRYRVQVAAPAPVPVLVGPALAPNLLAVAAWLAGLALGALLLVAGVALLIVGAVLGRRSAPSLVRYSPRPPSP